MFSRKSDDEDHLYDFNAAPGNLVGAIGKAPMTAYKGDDLVTATTNRKI